MRMRSTRPTSTDDLLSPWARPAVIAVGLAVLALTLAPYRPIARPDLAAGGPVALLRALAGGPGSSDDVELAQLYLPGRSASLADVGANALGGRAIRGVNIGAEAAFALGALGLFGARSRRVAACAGASTVEE